MSSLREELKRIQHKLIWHLRYQALVQAIIKTVLIATLLIAIDFRYRPDLILPRYFIAILFWSSLALIVFYRFIKVLGRKISLVETAFSVEGLIGQKTEEIAAIIQLENQMESNSGGNNLNELLSRNILDSTLKDSLRIKTRLFYLKSFLVIFSISILIFWSPDSTVIALSRIGNPNSEKKWPRLTKLQIYNDSMQKISPGSIISQVGRASTQFHVIDLYNDPPEEILLEIRRGSQAVKQIRLHGEKEKIHGEEIKTVYKFRLVPSPVDSIQFRVTGGDDTSMPWSHLLHEVKPAIVSLKCEVNPPEYLRESFQTIENWVGRLKIPTASTLDFEMILNRPVVAFRVQDGTGSIISAQEGRVASYNFSIHLPEISSEQLYYELYVKTSHEGAENEWYRVKRLQFEQVIDADPIVQLVTPKADRTVTPAAVLPIQATARDDNAIQSFRIVILAEEEFSLSAEDLEKGDLATINGQLNISLTNSEIGDTIKLFAEANDFNPKTSFETSSTVLLQVVSEKTKSDEINSGLKNLMREISANLTLIEATRSLLEELQDSVRIDLKSEKTLDSVSLIQSKIRQTLNQLNSAEFTQMRDTLQNEIQINEIEAPTIRSALSVIEQSIQSEINPSLEKGLNALRSVDQTLKSNVSRTISDQQLTRIVTQTELAFRSQKQAHQAAILLVSRLTDWVDASDLQLQWHLLLTDLENTQQKLSELAQETISLSVDEVLPEQRKKLEDAAEAQRDLVQKTQDLGEAFIDSGSEKWHSVGQYMAEQKVDEKLQRGTNLILQNNLLEAIRINQTTLEQFSELDSKLSQEEAQSRARLIELVKKNHQKFRELHKLQSNLSSQWLSGESLKQYESEQRNLQSKFRKLQQALESLGISQVADLLDEYDVLIDMLLNSSRELSISHTQVEEIEKKLNEIDMKFLESLERLLEREQQRLLDQIRRLAASLSLLQEKACTTVEEMITQKNLVGRLTRRQRRELIDISKVEEKIIESLTPLRAQLIEQSEILPLLSECLSNCEELVPKLVQGDIGPTDLTSMQNIREQLNELAQINPESGSSSHNSAEKISSDVRVRLEQLLKTQTELIQAEKRAFTKSNELPPGVEQSFQKKQLQIDQEIRILIQQWQRKTESE